jgi:very-short-patch-repair endonuclease
MTRAEKVLWINIRNEKILGVKFRRQFSVGKFILDFYSPSLRLAIEVDGASHDVDGAQRGMMNHVRMDRGDCRHCVSTIY